MEKRVNKKEVADFCGFEESEKQKNHFVIIKSIHCLTFKLNNETKYKK